ncbi:3-oxoacyl-[acyl-carrier-protein] synthase III C-terminal domain-containing protein [Cellulomonas sp. B6]|jgi:3-oxoacyl-[acyl-carrier-protein] synthase-3|uniref:3-oxoacyl-[acyl-carrier-protein] synthase III C-terminal domain-containing protein n=1 Tax=Cellulomonas sp. B6 TaxID=1295626 RepID=UPI00073B9D5E|nr:3-oxoacyl-[acyl-carrier-protein] synthase III C-terminal domain-containing protein [Cellulomonas sp. B6]KSW28531.1 hypothetical protein ATM99_11640 [Cellulomonas sp. B6]
MTAIVDVATYVPRQVPLAERQTELGISDQDLRRYSRAFGYEQVCYDPSQTEAQILLGAARALPGLAGHEHRVRYVLRPRTIRSASPYPHSPLREVTDALGLGSAQAFAVTEQACAAGLLALDTAGALLAADPDPEALALVLVGEKTYGTVGQLIPGMAVLGEATAAVLVAADGDRDVLLGYSATITPIPGSGLTMDGPAVAAFGAVYGSTLAAVVDEALTAAGLRAEDLALYLPHNINKMLCQRTASNLGLRRDQVVTDNIARTAHCWGADTFLNYRTAVDTGRLAPGDHYLMTSVGLGATFAAAVLRH